MTPKNNPLSTSEPWSIVSKGFEETILPFLSQYCETAIKDISLSSQANILDVACGPGTLARLVHQKVSTITALDFSPQMIDLLNDHIQKNQISNVNAVVGDGQNLPFEANHFDHAFSFFGLMFFPDRLKGFSELFRVLKPGGQAIVTSWAPVEQSPFMQLMFNALKAAKPDLPEPETMLDNLEKPEVFKAELEAAGFSEVSVTGVEHSMSLQSAEGFWQDMVKGSAPIAMLRKKTGAEEWDSMEKKAMVYLTDALPALPTTVSAKAWLGTGYKALEAQLK